MRIDVSRTMSVTGQSAARLRSCEPRRARVSFSCVAAPRIANGKTWWSQTGSNRRPHACKARALPAELWPRNQKTNASRRLLRRFSIEKRKRTRSEVVGLGRLELPTSRLSSARSNQLSYKPLTLIHSRNWSLHACIDLTPMHRTSAKPLARVRPRRKRNEDGEIPPIGLNDLSIDWPLMFLKRSDRSA